MAFLRYKTKNGRRYYQWVEAYREGGKPKQRVIKHIGPYETLERLILSDASSSGPFDVVRSVRYGDVSALNETVKQLRIEEAVQRVIPKGGGPDLGKMFVMMVINRCLDPVSRHRLPKWFSRTALPRLLDLPVDDVTPDTVYNALDYFDDDSIGEIQELLWKRLRGLRVKSNRVFYDLTSTYFEGSCVSFAKRGYSRDHREDRAQMNIGVAANAQGLPITHSIFPGNVLDKATLESAIADLRSRFNSRGILVLDRGFDTVKDKDLMASRGVRYIVGRRMTKPLRKFAASRRKFDYVQADPDDDRYFVQDAEYGGARVVIVWNKEMQEDHATTRERRLEKADRLLEALTRRRKRGDKPLTKKEVLAEANRILAECEVKDLIDLETNERGVARLKWTRNEGKIRWAKRSEGRFVLGTNTDLPAADVFWAYHQRNIVEQLIGVMKNVVDLRPVYVWTERHVKAHVGVCVTAVLVLQYLALRLKREGCNLSAVRALEELEDIHEVMIRNGERLESYLTGRTEEQRYLLNLIDVADSR